MNNDSNPFIKEDEDIVNLCTFFSDFLGRCVVHLTLDDTSGNSRALELIFSDRVSTRAFHDSLLALLNECSCEDSTLGDRDLVSFC